MGLGICRTGEPDLIGIGDFLGVAAGGVVVLVRLHAAHKFACRLYWSRGGDDRLRCRGRRRCGSRCGGWGRCRRRRGSRRRCRCGGWCRLDFFGLCRLADGRLYGGRIVCLRGGSAAGHQWGQQQRRIANGFFIQSSLYASISLFQTKLGFTNDSTALKHDVGIGP